MACCICFSDKPVEGKSKFEKQYAYHNAFQISMAEACTKRPGWCCLGFFCSCCSQYYIRKRALKGNLDNYICCQGYLGSCACCKPGSMGESSCPALCLCLESWCCLSCALSANRMFLMDMYQLHPDPWDNRIIRFNNFIQMLRLICDCLAICVPELRDVANIIDLIAECVFYSVAGCMTAQMVTELDYQESIAPKGEVMAR